MEQYTLIETKQLSIERKGTFRLEILQNDDGGGKFLVIPSKREDSNSRPGRFYYEKLRFAIKQGSDRNAVLNEAIEEMQK
jgi:hypothetical protein